MRRGTPWLCILALSLLGPAGAPEAGAQVPQGHPPVTAPGGAPDVAGGPGTIRGRLAHETRPEAGAGLPVVLYSLGASGTPGLRRVVAGPQGAFEFDNLSTAPGTVYLIGTRAQEIAFSARVAFAAGETERVVDLYISDPSPDASRVVTGELEIRIDRSCSHLRVSESHQLRNPGAGVIYVAEAARASSPPISRIVLPAGASQFETSLESLEHRLTQDGASVAFWGPLYPGEQKLEFSYALPAAEGQLSLRRELPGGAERVRVLTRAGGVRAAGEGLRPGTEEAPDGGPLRAMESGTLAPGSVLELQLEIPPVIADPAALSLVESRIWLDLDDAEMRVDEEYDLEVPGNAPLVSDSDAPLLCLPLPEGAQRLGLAPSSRALGLWADPAGVVAIHGPIPAGKSTMALRYYLAVDTESVAFARSFPRRITLLSMFVADTGLLLESQRLHRRRPVRTDTRTHFHLEAFEIEPDQPIELKVTQLEQRAGTPMLAKTGLVAVAALGAFGLLVAPLRGRDEEPAPETDIAAARAASQRVSVYGAIRDLDEDLETGKLSEEDHARFRAELRAQAVTLLQVERRARAGLAEPASAPSEATASAPSCPSCRAPTPPDARFCSHCGVQLPPDDSAGEESAG